MSLRDVSITLLVALILTPVVMTMFAVGYAQSMQSNNYKIQSDSINFGGGLSSSTNYTLESSAGEVGTGELGSTNYKVSAGYQQMVNAFISISSPSNVTMTPSIPGIAGGVANGSTTVTVTTDSAAGYQLSIVAQNTPALMKGADSIADYAPGVVPTFDFETGGDDSHFGYSPEGVDVVTRFRDNGVDTCNTGSDDSPFACWDGLSTTERAIANRTSANTPNGSTTTVQFRVGIGGSVVQAPGTYVATTTLTAVSL
jgi:hypothetical protein